MELFRANRGILAQKMMTVIFLFLLLLLSLLLLLLLYCDISPNLCLSVSFTIYVVIFSFFAGQLNNCFAAKHGHHPNRRAVSKVQDLHQQSYPGWQEAVLDVPW